LQAIVDAPLSSLNISARALTGEAALTTINMSE
jgi:hypothetical protein